MSPTCTGCLTVDECWGLQPEAAALLLCKHKTQLSSACGGRSTAKQGAWWAWDPREWSRLQQESRRSMLQYGSAARPAQGTWRMKMLRQNYISARLWPLLPGRAVMALLGRPTTEDMHAYDHRTRVGPASKTCLLLEASSAGHSQELGGRAGSAGTAGNPV